MDEFNLDAIIEYQMDAHQAKAYKLALIWQWVTKRLVPGTKCASLKRKGDPRKSELWRYCYKLVKETNGYMEDKDYKHYIVAQVAIIKGLARNGEHGLIHPRSLTGEKAWRRWHVWRKKYQLKQRTQSDAATDAVHTNLTNIKIELTKTKNFLINTFENEPKIEDFMSIPSNKFVLWMTMGKISSYYVLLSPYVQKRFPEGVEQELNFDLSIYKKDLTKEVVKFFNENFTWEFNTIA